MTTATQTRQPKRHNGERALFDVFCAAGLAPDYEPTQLSGVPFRPDLRFHDHRGPIFEEIYMVHPSPSGGGGGAGIVEKVAKCRAAARLGHRVNLTVIAPVEVWPRLRAALFGINFRVTFLTPKGLRRLQREPKKAKQRYPHLFSPPSRTRTRQHQAAA